MSMPAEAIADVVTPASHALRARRTRGSSTLQHLRALEAESIHIIREVAAEFAQPGDALLDRQGLVRHAAPGAEGVPPRADPVSAAAHRHHLQVPRDDRVPRLVCAARRRAADRAHQPGRDRRRHAAVRRRDPALLRPAQDEGAARRDPGRRVRRRVRRRPPRRGALARQGADLLAARRAGAVGSEAAASRAVAPAQQPGPAGREHPRVPAVELDRTGRLALHRRREHSRSCRCTSPRSARSSSAATR